MMNFKNFEILYGELKKNLELCAQIKANSLECEVWVLQTEKMMQERMKDLVAEFASHFPCSLETARRQPGFMIGHFWELLEKYPELASQNSAVLADYVRSMEAHYAGIPDTIRKYLNKETSVDEQA